MPPAKSDVLKIGPMPGIPPSANILKRKYRTPHAYKDLRNSWQRMIAAFLPAGSRQPETRKMKVTFTLEHSRSYDTGNAYNSVKPLEDALKNLGIIKDDSPEWIELHVEQVKSRENQTTIEIRPA